MNEKDFGITIYDRISRYFTLMIFSIVIIPTVIVLYNAIPWLQGIGAPEIIAIAISIIALVLSGAEFLRSQMLETRQEDIKALHGLRMFRFIMENTSEVRSLSDFDNLRNQSISMIDEAIPGTSRRFRRGLYWISVELRDIPLDYLNKYLIRRKKREERIEKNTDDDRFPDLDPWIMRVEKIWSICKLMIDRVEYVYFGGPVHPEAVMMI